MILIEMYLFDVFKVYLKIIKYEKKIVKKLFIGMLNIRYRL